MPVPMLVRRSAGLLFVCIAATLAVGCDSAPSKPARPPGCVLVLFRLDADRKPIDVHVLKSNPPGLYDDFAMESVRKAHYPQPPSKSGDKPYAIVIQMYDESHPHAPMPSCKVEAPTATSLAAP